MKTVSIVIATYRRNDSLKKALESLRIQTYADIEIVVVDDNGNFEWNAVVERIVEEFRQKNPNIPLKYICNEENQGSAETRNIGIRNARGDFITFLDDDDLYLPQKVERQVNFMMENQCDYCITDLDLYDENDRLIERRIRSYICDSSVKSLFRYHMLHHLTGTDTMMFTKDYLLQIGCFEPIDVGDEFYLMHKAIEAGGKFGYLLGSDIKAYVHTGEGGLSSGEQKIKGENLLFEFKKKYFHRLDKKSIRFIKMRHHAVVAYAYLRIGKFGYFFVYGLKAFFISPITSVRLFLNRK